MKKSSEVTFISIYCICVFLLKKILRLIAILVISFIAFLAGVILTSNSPESLKLSKSTNQDPDVLNTVRSIGAKDYSLLDMKVSSDISKDCDWPDVAGCYDDSSIALKSEYATDKTTVAHEYLHYMWYKNQLDKDYRLESDLIALLTRTPEFQTYLQYYYDNNILRLTELFSFACTEIQDSRLTPYIVQKCNEYIDRSTLQMKF